MINNNDIKKSFNKKKNFWEIDKIKEGFKKFFNENNRYPTATEIDECSYLPASRTLQRRFNGVVGLRQALKLDITDFTKGKVRSEKAKNVNKRAYTLEKNIYDFLNKKFGVEFVHREYFFSDDHRTRTDFFVYHKHGQFSVDVFYPSNKHNFIGCLNSKMRTYRSDVMMQYPVIFLQMNENLKREDIDKVLINKKNKLRSDQQVMCYEEFKNFCSKKTSNTVI
ncbi:hypothetical protein A3B84_00055 [Candidatus Nomurabacteria bacterium RIFCSPHIGHO2_02_FULL_35_13]|uniref:Uncharacterized protein n=1 Tax=Candidatus Nomurabacteria bacterium RIFCSPHIGHO2_02_FULL_35_13 TaxID=1801748 RepID=A0A1F6VPU5_9BACT|nr:MAG: hypothetical protein A3B84_00055 [Candidatus Nomurabacteria bacterium RIFCSPHIGHO2_02_FULL_35_13]